MTVEPEFPPSVVGMRPRRILRELLRTHFHQPAICLFRAHEIVELCDLTFAAPVLDLGCGTGDVGDLVLRSHHPIIGLDLIPSELRVARRRAAYAGLTAADATLLPFADGSFGSVVSICVFEHIPDDLAAVREVARVLRPGGKFIFTTPSAHFEEFLLGARDTAAVAAVNARLGHFHYRSEAEWRTILADAGLEPLLHRHLLPPRSQRVWQRLDRLMVSRVAGRRVLDVLRALHRRRLLPLGAWSGGLSWILDRFAMGRTDGGPGGAQLIVSRKFLGGPGI